MKNKLLLVLLFLLIVLGFLTCANSAYAATFGGGSATINISQPEAVPTAFGEGNVEGVVRKIFNVIIVVSEIAFMVLLLVGGIMYLTAGLSENQAEKARKLMLDAIVGLIIVLAAWAIGTWIIARLRTDTPAGMSGTATPTLTATTGSGLPSPGP